MKEEEYCYQVSMDINNAGLKMFRKSDLQMFYKVGNVFQASLFKSTHNAFWWVTLNTEPLYVYKKTPHGTFKLISTTTLVNDFQKLAHIDDGSLKQGKNNTKERVIHLGLSHRRMWTATDGAVCQEKPQNAHIYWQVQVTVTSSKMVYEHLPPHPCKNPL